LFTEFADNFSSATLDAFFDLQGDFAKMQGAGVQPAAEFHFSAMGNQLRF
jgi:hypothetical protein